MKRGSKLCLLWITSEEIESEAVPAFRCVNLNEFCVSIKMDISGKKTRTPVQSTASNPHTRGLLKPQSAPASPRAQPRFYSPMVVEVRNCVTPPPSSGSGVVQRFFPKTKCHEPTCEGMIKLDSHDVCASRSATPRTRSGCTTLAQNSLRR